MTGRTPSWKERENNRRRERRRRAISANIYNGLRNYGNYSLPKHCDNNQVLIALCHEAGWIVEPDGTTYRKGQKPPPHLDTMTRPTSISVSPCSSSYQPSPYTSFNPSPVSSSLASPSYSSYLEGGSLIPWLKNLSSASSSASSSKLTHLYTHGRSVSAPVSPPFLSSPGRQPVPDCDWWGGIRGTNSPTFSLVSARPSGGCSSSSQMLTPLQSGTCSPAVAPAFDQNADVPMSDDFAFACGSKGLVKAWEGEIIHEESSDDLELTLACSNAR